MAEERIRLVVLFGGRSAEHDVSCVSAKHVLAAVDTDRYDVEPVGITRDGDWVLASDAMAALAKGAHALPARLDPTGPSYELLPELRRDADRVVVLPLLHGPMGEDGTMQGLLELADVPYVGAGVLGSAVAMDKAMAKDICAFHGIPQTAYLSVRAHERSHDTVAEAVERLGLPIFVKPANMGSSIGVSRASTAEELEAALDLAFSYDELVVLEEAVDAREIECSVLGNESPRASLPGEIRPGAVFYDYEDKYLADSAELIIPAPLDDAVVADLRAMAIRAFTALRCEGMARADFFYEEGGRGLLFNELNTIPGFTPISMYPQMWQASGLSYPDLIDELVNLAIARHDRKPTRTDRT